MYTNQIFEIILNLGNSWRVTSTKVNVNTFEVDIYIDIIGNQALSPDLADLYPIYDRRKTRRWRHLDTLQYKTFLHCRVPRVKTPSGVQTISVPWASDYERHTYLFERLVIDLLKATKNQTTTSKLLRTGFNVINRIIHRSVERGLALRDSKLTLRNYSIDEKSFRKGHSYVSVLSSPLAGVVVDVVENRDKKAVKKLLSQAISTFDTVETISMDMWPAYINTVKKSFQKRILSMIDFI